MLKRFGVIFVLIFLVSFPLETAYSYYTNMPASVVVGQQDFTGQTGGLAADKFSTNGGTGIRAVFIDQQGRMIVSDGGNNRVLVWNRIPTINGAPADLVLGQSDFVSGTANKGGVADASTLSGPIGLWPDGNKLIVGDAGNNRVLIWNTFPSSNGQSADVVVGQSTMTGVSASCDSLHTADIYGIAVFQGKLVLSSQSQNRILIYNSIPRLSGANADIVLGQTDFVTCTAGSISSGTFSSPRGIHVDINGRLFLADRTRNRILIWNTFPSSNGQSADVVVGQNDFATSTSGTTQSSLNLPATVYSTGTRLIVTDTQNGRVLIYNSVPITNGALPDILIGKETYTSNATSCVVSATCFKNGSSPIGMFLSDNKLFVGDGQASRILIFNNVLSSPQIGISTTETLSDGRIRVKGTVEVGERGRYSLSSVTASVNGEGYGNVTSRDGGRDNGVDKTLYEYTHEFSPWQNNGSKETWNDRGYSLSIKATTSNAEESSVFVFSPFNFVSISGESSRPTFNFSVSKYQWSTISSNLDSYEIQTKKNNENQYQTYLSNIPVSASTNPLLNTTYDSNAGTVVVSSKDKTLLPGVYTVRIVAKDKSGHVFPSNTISYTTKSAYSSFIPSTSSFHLSLTSISGVNPQLASYLKPVKTDFYTAVTTPVVFKGIAYAGSDITLSLIQQDCTKECVKNYTTKTLPNSSFLILVPNKDLLSNKRYTAFLGASLSGQETYLPSFVVRR